MNRKKKKFFKFLARKTQRNIWQAELSLSIITNLTLNFAEERLKLLKIEQAKWIAKDTEKAGEGRIGKKENYDILKKFEDDIKREENMVRGAKIRIESIIKSIQSARGEVDYIKDFIRGRFN